MLAWRALADAPVAVAANRDEARDRESRPPRVLSEEPAVVAPQDAVAGGTWIGVTERGLLVAITNRWTEAGAPDLPAGRSRGLLVRDALEAPDARAAVDHVREAVEAADYEGFNLVAVDADNATYLEWDGALRETPLDPGVHVVLNPGLNEADSRATRLRAALDPEAAGGDGGGAGPDGSRGESGGGVAARSASGHGRPGATEWLASAAGRLRDHRYGACIHRESFGTRSSSLVAIDEGKRATYRFADGPPCRTAYEPVDVPAGFLEERG